MNPTAREVIIQTVRTVEALTGIPSPDGAEVAADAILALHAHELARRLEDGATAGTARDDARRELRLLYVAHQEGGRCTTCDARMAKVTAVLDDFARAVESRCAERIECMCTPSGECGKCWEDRQ